MKNLEEAFNELNSKHFATRIVVCDRKDSLCDGCDYKECTLTLRKILKDLDLDISYSGSWPVRCALVVHTGVGSEEVEMHCFTRKCSDMEQAMKNIESDIANTFKKHKIKYRIENHIGTFMMCIGGTQCNRMVISL
jgi:hypothetical protein